MRRALILACALALNAAALQRAEAARVCAWVTESIEDGDTHRFELTLSADAPVSVAAKFEGPGFTSAATGGDMIPLTPGQPKVVDGEGFDVAQGDDLRFEVGIYDRAIANLDELAKPKGRRLAAFVFERKVGAGEHAPPPILAVKQCVVVG